MGDEPEDGVVKFEMKHTHMDKLFLNPDNMVKLEELNEWRNKFFNKDIIGCDLSRYGACYGNVSMRYIEPSLGYHRYQPEGERAFLISGTQTGSLQNLTEKQYVRIYKYNSLKNMVLSEGPIKPSSETMTHGAIYDLAQEINVVLHAHAPTIWEKSNTLAVPETNNNVAYGTPEMAKEVKKLYEVADLRIKKILSMGGHRDGIISFGETVEEAGGILERYLMLSC